MTCRRYRDPDLDQGHHTNTRLIISAKVSNRKACPDAQCHCGYQDAPGSLADQEGVLRLADNVWQVNFHDNPGAFARLVSCAMYHKLTYGILQLKDAPTWHPAAFHPKPR
jgi:hypothetical protein